MKKIKLLFIMIFLLMLSSCSVQENMSSLIFIQRLEKQNKAVVIDTEDMYIKNDEYIVFAGDENEKPFVLSITVDDADNVKKICLACNNTNKAEDFKIFAENIIKAYSPYDDPTEVLSMLFSEEWSYYDTQWYSYASSTMEDSMFFSVKSKKLSTESDARLTLKQNDITTY